MASLYKRATPRQAMVLRMIEGAVKNAAHAHPGKMIDDRMARSIAKRATGTLISQWKSVLAAPQGRSEGANGNVLDRSAAGDGQLRSVSGSAMLPAATWPRGASQVSWRTPLFCVKLAIGAACGEARREGSADREEALKDVLRLLAEVLSADFPPRPGEDHLHLKVRDVAMGPRR